MVQKSGETPVEVGSWNPIVYDAFFLHPRCFFGISVPHITQHWIWVSNLQGDSSLAKKCFLVWGWFVSNFHHDFSISLLKPFKPFRSLKSHLEYKLSACISTETWPRLFVYQALPCPNNMLTISSFGSPSDYHMSSGNVKVLADMSHEILFVSQRDAHIGLWNNPSITG